MKYIEVIEATAPPNGQSAPGAYLFSGMLYIVHGNGNFPTSWPIGAVPIKSGGVDGQAGGIDGTTLLRAMAMAANPALAGTIIDKM